MKHYFQIKQFILKKIFLLIIIKIKKLYKEDKIIYNTNLREANTIEETLIAYIFIRKQMRWQIYNVHLFQKKI